ncbi:preATP grasp domain-containing protein [Streptomyces sp. 6N223]|uniref:preATP grasp domain-containing protein n=1 Tax=Streptomyces sp. 6N223 TaxID=3457412 RepID=UPI003FD5608B
MFFANFVSDTVGGPHSPDLNLQGMVQSSRKLWLMRPGDVLVTQFPVSEAFTAYVCGLLGFDPASITLLAAPPDPTVPLADAVESSAGLRRRLRAAVAARPGIELLPMVLDHRTVDFAARLGVPVHPYGPGGVPDSALASALALNTKRGFRETAVALGIRVPAGRFCPDDGPALAAAVREMLAAHPRVLLKPARAAGGHGHMSFARADGLDALDALDERLASHRAALGPQAEGWVVEEHLPVARDVSAQVEVTPAGPELVYTGEMRTRGNAFHGFVSPLPDPPPALADAALRLGTHLAERGYRGRLSLDAALTAGPGSRLCALESNVRRTATTARHALARRLSRTPSPAWVIDSRPGPHHGDVARAEALLRKAGLAWNRQRAEGVVFSAEATAPDAGRHSAGWHYAVVAPDRGRAERLERELHALLRDGSRAP